MLQEVLNLCREIEAHLRVGAVKCPGHFARMTRPVEKVRIAKCDVPRAGLNLLGNVGYDRFDRHDEKAAIVNRHDRTVAAGVQATAAGLNISGLKGNDFLLFCRLNHVMRVVVQGRERRSIWLRESKSLQLRLCFLLPRR